MKAEHPAPTTTEESVTVVENVPQPRKGNVVRIRLPGDPPVPEPTQLIPMQDFDPECLRELAALANKEDVEIVLERLTIKPLRRKRAEEALKSIQPLDYAHSLRCLDQDLNTVAAGILDKFHGDPARPQLHIIHRGDLSRKTVKVYSRPREHDQSRWLTLAKEPALDTLSGHASAVLTYMIELASRKLRYKFCDKEKVVCFCLHDPEQEKNLIIIDANDLEDNTSPAFLALRYEPRLKVLFYSGTLSEIVQGYGYTAKATKLGKLIAQKMDEVLEQLKTLAFKEADVISFLEKTRRFQQN